MRSAATSCFTFLIFVFDQPTLNAQHSLSAQNRILFRFRFHSRAPSRLFSDPGNSTGAETAASGG